MGATFSRVKNWTTEVLSYSDLNAEIDNILNNLGPAGVDDYSTNAAQMKLQTSPGTLGSESLATSLAGELERMRYVIQRVIGSDVDYWYEAPPSSISDLVASLGTGLPTYRIVSGQTTGNSSQLAALRPAGTTAAVTLTASGTPFVYYIGGTQYSITANVTLTGLSLASGTNNTCSVNETAASGQQWTKFLGQYGTTIEVDGMDSGISTLVGQIAGFKTSTEYFLAYVSSTTSLTNAWRGCFFNSTPTNVAAVGLSNNDEIKLMKMAWLFANTNSSLAVTYNNPTISAEQPTSPGVGDYWFDLATTAWKTYNSTTWVAANAILIGVTLQDTANCVAARTFDPFKAMSDLNTLNLQRDSNTVVRASDIGAEVSIFGATNRFSITRPQWDITTDLDSGVSETLSTTYYLYMKENGNTVISDRAPLDRKDLYGLYHPGEAWRCLGSVYNDSSTNFVTPARSFRDIPDNRVLMGDPLAYNSVNGVGSSFAPGAQDLYPNNYIQVYSTASQSWPSTAAFSDLQTISFSAGVWAVSALLEAITGSAPGTLSQIGLAVSFTAGNTLGLPQASCLHQVNGVVPNTALYVAQVILPESILVFSTPTTVYLKCLKIPGAAATVDVNAWRLTARRLDQLIGSPA